MLVSQRPWGVQDLAGSAENIRWEQTARRISSQIWRARVHSVTAVHAGWCIANVCAAVDCLFADVKYYQANTDRCARGLLCCVPTFILGLYHRAHVSNAFVCKDRSDGNRASSSRGRAQGPAHVFGRPDQGEDAWRKKGWTKAAGHGSWAAQGRIPAQGQGKGEEEARTEGASMGLGHSRDGSR